MIVSGANMSVIRVAVNLLAAIPIAGRLVDLLRSYTSNTLIGLLFFSFFAGFFAGLGFNLCLSTTAFGLFFLVGSQCCQIAFVLSLELCCALLILWNMIYFHLFTHFVIAWHNSSQWDSMLVS